MHLEVVEDVPVVVICVREDSIDPAAHRAEFRHAALLYTHSVNVKRELLVVELRSYYEFTQLSNKNKIY